MTHTITSVEQFDELISSHPVALIDFAASWCGPCKTIAPIIDELADINPDVAVAKVDVDDVSALAQRYKIMSVPTVIVFRDGDIAAAVTGARPGADYQAAIDTARS